MMTVSLTRKNAARVYFFMILLVAPLYISNGFVNILRAKTYIVWLSIVIGAILAVSLFVKSFMERLKEKSIASDFRYWAKEFFLSINVMDVLVASFGIICIISAALSEYPKEAFSGSMAWNVGALMLFFLCVMYFIYSRFMSSDFVGFFGMMLGGTIAMILAVLNDLWIDPLHILTEDVNWRDHFTSTIGNIDQFSGYLSVIIPVMVMMFVVSDSGFKRAAASIVLFFSYLNMFLTHADSVYIGVGVGYVFIIAFCLRKSERYMGLLINGILFGLSGFAARVIILYRPEIRLDDISPILLSHNFHIIIGGVCFCLLLLHLFLELRFPKEKLERLLTIIFWVYASIAVISFIGIVIYIATHYDFNLLNRRGFLWYVAVYSYLDADTLQQIIGIGPGCVDAISQNFYFEIIDAYGDFYFLENLHNDVLEYLVTTGITGALAYFGIYMCVLYEYIKMVLTKKDEAPNMCYAMIGIVGYIAQSILNGPHPLSTAIFFVLLTIYRGEKLRNNRK